MTDPTQNNKFSDHYFYGMEFDLSKVFYVFTFNDINKIDKILLDRLNIIRVDTPSDDDIIQIVENHCIPEIIINIGIKKSIEFNRNNIRYIIDYCKDFINKTITSGIREYYRVIEKIFLELNKKVLFNPEDYSDELIVINESLFKKLFDNIKGQLYCTQEDSFNIASHMYI